MISIVPSHIGEGMYPKIPEAPVAVCYGWKQIASHLEFACVEAVQRREINGRSDDAQTVEIEHCTFYLLRQICPYRRAVHACGPST
jgi:hypothetical protein